MMIRRAWGLVLVASMASVIGAAEPVKAPSGPVLDVVADRSEAIYHVGEPVTFKIVVTENGKAVSGVTLTYTIDKDNWGKPIASGKITTSAEPVTVSAVLKEPGFLKCHVSGGKGTDGKPLLGLGGAGVDPLLIKPSLPVPDDFDAFWAAQKAELAKVEMKAKLTPKQGSKNVEVFDVQVDCAGGKPVSGYYARPVGAKPKSCAAILTVHGAGVRSSSLGGPMGQANRGHISMDINAHGIPNGEPDDFYKKLADGELKDYRSAGREKRETVYFRGMFLRLVRAIDFLTAQPEWDGKVVIVTGGSQGGYQSIVAAGLDPRVTCIAAGVPAGCDHSGNVADRIAGWPKIVPLGKDGKPDPVILENARYYDAMNFATRFKGDAIFSVGFIDGTCPPTSVYAAYNNLNCRSKSIVNEPRMGHSSTPHIGDEFFKVMDAHIKRMHASQ